MSERIEYIDIAKGIGIILVVIGHCISGNGIAGKWIWSFHMPLFFFISGFCFTNNKYLIFSAFAQKRLKQLLLPCLYFTFLITTLEFAFMEKRNFTTLAHHLPGALWFIPILFFSELSYYAIDKFTHNYLSIIILISSAFIGTTLHQYQVDLPYSLTTIFPAMVFYGIGNMSKSFMKTFQNRLKKSPLTSTIISITTLTIPLLAVLIMGRTIDLTANFIKQPIIDSYMIALLGILGILFISNLPIRSTKIKNAIIFLGKNTLVIMAIHILLIRLSTFYIMPLISSHLLYKAIEQAFIWISLWFCIYFFNNKASWIIGK